MSIEKMSPSERCTMLLELLYDVPTCKRIQDAFEYYVENHPNVRVKKNVSMPTDHLFFNSEGLKYGDESVEGSAPMWKHTMNLFTIVEEFRTCQCCDPDVQKVGVTLEGALLEEDYKAAIDELVKL